MKFGFEKPIFEAMFTALKPGGILGVVEHRANPDEFPDPQTLSGYVHEEQVIEMAEDAGFKFLEKSEINANPADTRDHPEGVWTLPPGLRLKDKDRKKYLAIGESDRMTLKFVKPAS
jgi:predicted methyltransferase